MALYLSQFRYCHDDCLVNCSSNLQSNSHYVSFAERTSDIFIKQGFCYQCLKHPFKKTSKDAARNKQNLNNSIFVQKLPPLTTIINIVNIFVLRMTVYSLKPIFLYSSPKNNNHQGCNQVERLFVRLDCTINLSLLLLSSLFLIITNFWSGVLCRVLCRQSGLYPSFSHAGNFSLLEMQVSKTCQTVTL